MDPADSPSESPTSREATSSPGRPDDWLPLVRSRSALGRQNHLSRPDIEAAKHRDWFLAFAWLLREKDDTQSWMLAKSYLFLRDYMPRGLTGRWSHISGNELIRLLISGKDTAASRHKVSVGVKTSFHSLYKWLRTQEFRPRLQRGAGPEGRAPKKKPTEKAPGLRSPVAILAALIIEYPCTDSKFRSWISSLQIGWMLDRRESLYVQDGRWEGLDHLNLKDHFEPDSSEHIPCDKVMLADYDSLLGNDFLDCRRDIRAFVPGYSLNPLSGEPSDIEDSESGTESSGLGSTGHSTRGRASDDSEDDGEPAAGAEEVARRAGRDTLRLHGRSNRPSQASPTQGVSAGHEVQATPHGASRRAGKYNLPTPNRPGQEVTASQHRPHASKAGDPREVPNRMAGKTHVPKKRAHGPQSVPRSAKMPRLGGAIATRDGLPGQLDEVQPVPSAVTNDEVMDSMRQISEAVTDLRRSLNTMREDLNVDLERHTDATRNAVRYELRRTQENMRQMLELRSTHWSNTTQLLTEVMQKDTKDALTADRRQQQHKFDRLAEALHKQQDDLLSKLDIQAVVQDAIGQRLVSKLDVQDAVQDALGQQSEARELPPQPGHTGYLGQCQSPPGWEQGAYESELVRAALLYISSLGVPRGGVTEDEGAWNIVLQSFPNLNEDHIFIALDHIHVQAYGRLFVE